MDRNTMVWDARIQRFVGDHDAGGVITHVEVTRAAMRDYVRELPPATPPAQVGVYIRTPSVWVEWATLASASDPAFLPEAHGVYLSPPIRQAC